jgi:hypothetical protein
MPPRTSIVAKVPVATAPAPVAARLKTFGLSAAKLQLTNNLEVPMNQTVTLDASDQKLAAQLARATPKTIDDLKTWLGVPDAAFTQAAAPVARPMAVLPVHEAYTPDQSAALYGVARAYIFGNSAAVSQAQIPALNAWLASIAGSISIITFQDIHVAAGARLVVNPSITVLFARYITIDQGGVIQVRCTHGGINCAGIKGASPRVIPLPIGPLPNFLNQ